MSNTQRIDFGKAKLWLQSISGGQPITLRAENLRIYVEAEALRYQPDSLEIAVNRSRAPALSRSVSVVCEADTDSLNVSPTVSYPDVGEYVRSLPESEFLDLISAVITRQKTETGVGNYRAQFADGGLVLALRFLDDSRVPEDASDLQAILKEVNEILCKTLEERYPDRDFRSYRVRRLRL